MVDRIHEQLDDMNRQVTALYEPQQFEQAIPLAEQLRTFAERHWWRQCMRENPAIRHLASGGANG